MTLVKAASALWPAGARAPLQNHQQGHGLSDLLMATDTGLSDSNGSFHESISYIISIQVPTRLDVTHLSRWLDLSPPTHTHYRTPPPTPVSGLMLMTERWLIGHVWFSLGTKAGMQKSNFHLIALMSPCDDDLRHDVTPCLDAFLGVLQRRQELV